MPPLSGVRDPTPARASSGLRDAAEDETVHRDRDEQQRQVRDRILVQADGLGDTVIVLGGPEPGTATTTDRTYLPGRYLFVVDDRGGVLVDSACSGTRAWTDELAPLRPAGVAPAAVEVPTDPLGSINPGQLAAVAGLLVALLVAIVAYLYVLRARRRPPDWIR
jgi:hypothetical protein